MIRFSRYFALIAMFLILAVPAVSLAAREYKESTQAELTKDMELLLGKDVVVDGTFLFTGSEFCYKMTDKINTREYFCFALGPVNLIRFYIKKNHIQVPELLGLKRGATLRAYGNFDSIGKDYKYIVVDHFEVVSDGGAKPAEKK